MLDSAKASLKTLAARISLQQALIAQSEGGVTESQAEQQRAQQLFSRIQELRTKEYSSQDELDQQQASLLSAKAHLAEAKAALVAKQRELPVYQAQLIQAQANVEQAQAGLDLAMIYLNETKVTAPFSGIIGQRGAQPGQYVQPGQPIYTLVPDDFFWITANFKETQIRNMHPGQVVSIKLDAFPSQNYTGVVQSLSPASGSQFSLLPAENATGNFTKIVQRIPVRIKVNQAKDKHQLRPGLSAEVRVDTRPGPLSATSPDSSPSSTPVIQSSPSQ